MRRLIWVLFIINTLFFYCDKLPFASDSDSSSDNSENTKILFYAFPGSNNSDISIFTIDEDGSNLNKKIQGHNSYPTWITDKQRIAYQNLDTYSIMSKNLENPTATDIKICDYNYNIMFLRYSNALESYIFSYKDRGLSRIGMLDKSSNQIIPISTLNYDEINPVTSYNDDWIYFSTNIHGTYDIYKVKKNGDGYQPVLIDDDNLNSFSISNDGEILVTPSYSENSGKIIVYDLVSEENLYIIEPTIPGIPLYTSLSSDNKYIYFVNGIPYDYVTPRNVYKVNIDGSGLKQLTDFDNLLANRPLEW